jgi:hypothetical protein
MSPRSRHEASALGAATSESASQAAPTLRRRSFKGLSEYPYVSYSIAAEVTPLTRPSTSRSTSICTRRSAPGRQRACSAHSGESGVNLLALSGFPDGRRAQIDLVPEDPAALRAAARRHGWKLTGPKKVLLLSGDDRVGAMADVAERLARRRSTSSPPRPSPPVRGYTARCSGCRPLLPGIGRRCEHRRAGEGGPVEESGGFEYLDGTIHVLGRVSPSPGVERREEGDRSHVARAGRECQPRHGSAASFGPHGRHPLGAMASKAAIGLVRRRSGRPGACQAVIFFDPRFRPSFSSIAAATN